MRSIHFSAHCIHEQHERMLAVLAIVAGAARKSLNESQNLREGKLKYRTTHARISRHAYYKVLTS